MTKIRHYLFALSLLILAGALCVPSLRAEEAGVDEAWNSRLKALYFQERELAAADGVFSIDTPVRAEDGALVPLAIKAAIPQTEARYIRALYVIIDNNPSPLAGTFHLTPATGKADLELRIRVNAYSPVRVVAETNDGRLWMDSRFVKASGGCSAPVGTDLESAMQRLGKMRFRLENTENMSLANPLQARLAISHPNITGLQKDQVTTLFIPPHYVKTVEVKFAGKPLFSAETDISISENPNFRFYFVPGQPGKLTATVTDTKGQVFTHEELIGN